MQRRDFLKFIGASLATTLVQPSSLAELMAAADQRTRWLILQKEFCHVHMDLLNAQEPYLSLHEILKLPYDQTAVVEDLAAIQRHASTQSGEVRDALRELRTLYRKYVSSREDEAFARMAQNEARAVLNVNGGEGAQSAIGDEMRILRMNEAEYSQWEKEAFKQVEVAQKATEKTREKLEKKQKEFEDGPKPKYVPYRDITHKHGDGQYRVTVARGYDRGKWEPKEAWLKRAGKHARELQHKFTADIQMDTKEFSRGHLSFSVEPESKAERYMIERMRAQLSETVRKY